MAGGKCGDRPEIDLTAAGWRVEVRRLAGNRPNGGRMADGDAEIGRKSA